MDKYNELFNRPIKEKYFDTLPNNASKKNIINTFIRLSIECESMFNKDLYEMTSDELSVSLSMLDITSYSTLRQIMSFIIDYIDWCQATRITAITNNSARNVEIYDIDIKKSLLKSFIKDEQSLIEVIETVYDLNDLSYMPVVLCLFWMGFDVANLFELKDSDVDLSSGFVKFKKRKFKIPNTFIEVFKKYLSVDEGSSQIYDSKHRTKYKEKTDKYIKRICFEPNKIFEKPINRIVINSQLMNFRRKYFEETQANVDYGSSSIRLSGKFFRIYQFEKQGRQLDLKKELGGKTNSATIISDEIQRYRVYKNVFWGE